MHNLQQLVYNVYKQGQSCVTDLFCMQFLLVCSKERTELTNLLCNNIGFHSVVLATIWAGSMQQKLLSSFLVCSMAYAVVLAAIGTVFVLISIDIALGITFM